jgi:prepilin-type N-terminal cleavage/methylation domain-containing protein
MTSPRQRHLSQGFTLVELLVSVGIFAVIMTLSAGAYLVIIDLNAHAQATALAADNISFVFENMTRSIRTGSGYGCLAAGTDCVGGTAFSFVDAGGQNITYTFVPAAGGVNGYIRETVAGSSFSLTDTRVNITSLAFYLTGSAGTGAGNYTQPFVRMTITGTAVAGKGQTFSFSIESAATTRGIDI